MMWIVFAVIGYVAGAITNVLDKFILASKIPSPVIYAFYAALFNVFAVALVPLGLTFIPFSSLFLSLLSGIVFSYGLLFFYRAVKVSEITRVAPLAGSLMAIGTLAFEIIATSSSPDTRSLMAFWLLTLGGFLVTFDIPFRPRIMFRGFWTVAIASVLLALSLILLKEVYTTETFVNGYAWSRFGAIFGGLSMFLLPSWRREIIESLTKKKSRPSRVSRSSAIGWFVLNKLSGAASALLVAYAVSKGSLAFVHALAGIQYAAVFLIVVIASQWRPHFMEEKLALNDWVQKWAAILLIGVGLWYASLGAVSIG